MEEQDQPDEYVVEATGPAHFLDVVFENVDAYIARTGEEYADIITGVDGVDAGNVGEEEEAVLNLYVLGRVPPEEAREQIDIVLDRISDDYNMTIARQGVELTIEESEVGEE